MALEDIDLTLDSTFAADEKRNLFLRDAWKYQNDTAPDDGRYRLGFDSIEFNPLLFIQVSPRSSILSTVDELDDVDNYVNYFYSVFGALPKWYKSIDPYSMMYDENICDCCGKRIHLLNKVGGLCIDCNDRTGTVGSRSRDNGLGIIDETSHYVSLSVDFARMHRL